MPHPDGRGEVLQTNNYANEAISFCRIMSRPHLQNHLVFLTEIECVGNPSPAQIPNMHAVAILGFHQQVWLKTVLDHLRCRPLRAQECVMQEMPPEIVVKILVAAIDFPLPEHIEAKMVEQEDPAGPIPRT